MKETRETTHGPRVSVHGSCRSCEFLSRPVQGAFHYCYYIDGAPIIPDLQLSTPAWCPLLPGAAANVLAETPAARPAIYVEARSFLSRAAMGEEDDLAALMLIHAAEHLGGFTPQLPSAVAVWWSRA